MIYSVFKPKMTNRKVGFDDFNLRQDYINILCANQERQAPEIRIFKEMMDNFYDGAIWMDKEKSPTIEQHRLEHMKTNTKDELFYVITSQYQNNDTTNLNAAIYTQNTQEELGDTLQTFGLELEKKYAIEEINDPKIIAHYMHPVFRFVDIQKINQLLQKVKLADTDFLRGITTIINALGRTIYNGFDNERTDNELDISMSIKELNTQLQRLGLREEDMMTNRRSLFIALEQGCLTEFKESIKLGFYCDIEEGFASKKGPIQPPAFFEEILRAEEKNNEIINMPTMCKALLESIGIGVQECHKFLIKVKDKPLIFKRLAQELVAGLLTIRETIKSIKNLEIDERRLFIRQFDEYLTKIADLNEEKIF